MSRRPRDVPDVNRLLVVLLQDPSAARSGGDIAREADVALGHVYAPLAELERCGWVESWWEDELAPYPRKRVYRLTAGGEKLAIERSRSWTSNSG